MAIPNGSICMDCGQNTSWMQEFYMLHQDVWDSIVTTFETSGMLCIGDVERRLGRQLTPDDFDPKWRHLTPFVSERLVSRRGY